MEAPAPQSPKPAEKKGSTWKQVRIVLLLLLLGVLALIIIKNRHGVSFWLFAEYTDTPLIVLLLLAVLLGAIITAIVLSVRASRKRNEVLRLSKENRKLQEELQRSSHR